MNTWYEDETQWTHVGYVETGSHSIYEFEIYRNNSTGELVGCDHEDPDEPTDLDNIKEFFEERGDLADFETEIARIKLEDLAKVIDDTINE